MDHFRMDWASLGHRCDPMAPPPINGPAAGGRPLHRIVRRWQDARSWARLIREAEALWHIDVRDLHRLAALELGQLIGEVPGRQRPQVNRWLAWYRVATRLTIRSPWGSPGQADRNS